MTEPNSRSGTLTLREKSLIKRRINREHNSNFDAGYVHVNEEYLHKTGLRGRKRYIIYGILTVLGLTVAANFMVTCTLITVLRIGKDGMESLEFFTNFPLLRFLGNSNVNVAKLHKDTILSRPHEHIEICGNDHPAILQVNDGKGQRVAIDVTKMQLLVDEDFEVFTPEGQRIFTTDYTELQFPQKTYALDSQQITTPAVVSEDDSDLDITSTGDIHVDSDQDIHVSSDNIYMYTLDDINLQTGDSLHLRAGGGIVLDQIHKIPVANMSATPTREGEAGEDSEAAAVESYKVCVCMPSGYVFLIGAPERCDQTLNPHPCASVQG